MKTLKAFRLWLVLAILTTTVVLFQNCGDYKFTQGTPQQANLVNISGVPTCSQVLQNTTENLRIIFMVDNSGSTLTTDPKEKYRVLTIQDFLSQYSGKTNFSYSYGFFASNSSSLYDNSTGNFVASPNSPIFDATGLSNALQAYEKISISSNANTPYASGFNEINSVIAGDSASGYNYVVVFMSDGAPNPNLSQSQLLALVDGLSQTAKSKGALLSLSTIYFGPETGVVDTTNNITAAQAQANLQAMAKEGSGQFIDTNVTTAVNIDDVITVPGTVCQ